VLLSAGIWPFFFRNQQQGRRREQQGIAIFLDVSGSVNQHLPKLVGLLSRYRERINTVFLFSNRVVESSFDVLCAGTVRTTWGTDFDCIAKTVIEQAYDRAVVITDGHAALNNESATALHAAGARILTILFGGKLDCPEFAPFGDVVQLNDVVDD